MKFDRALQYASPDDTPLGQARELVGECKRTGVPYQLIEVPSSKHALADSLTHLSALHETVAEASNAFLRKWIGNSRS